MADVENGETRLALAAVLDLNAATPLHAALLGRRGQALVIDGAGVRHLGAQCLQVLLAAQAAWAADDQTLRIENGSADFLATLDLLGLAPEALAHHRRDPEA